MNKLFEELIAKYTLQPCYAEAAQHAIEAIYKDINKESEDNIVNFKARLAEVAKKLDTLEEKYYVNAEMNRETFEKFHFKYKGEHAGIAKQLNVSNSGLSKLDETIKKQ